MRRAAVLLIGAIALPLGACDNDDNPATSARSGPTSATSSSASSSSSSSAAESSTTATSLAPSAPAEATPSESETPVGEGAADILHTSRESTASATSASVKSLVTVDENLVHIRGQRDGTNQEILTTSTSNGIARTRRVGDMTFINGNALYWRDTKLTPQRRKELTNRWGPIASDQTYTSYTYTTMLTDFWTLIDQLHPTNDASTPVAKVTRDGKPALQITLGTKATVFVSADAKHLLLHAVTTDATLDFSEWNAVKPFTAPPEDQIAPPR